MSDEERIQKLESEGLTRSDAQGVLEYEEYKRKNKMNPTDVMTKLEIEKRHKNQLQYKFNALISTLSDNEIKHKGNEDIIKSNNKNLSWLKEVESKINQMFNNEFEDEPTDEDIKNYMKGGK